MAFVTIIAFPLFQLTYFLFRFKLGSLKRIRLTRNKQRTISNCYLTNDHLHSNETNFCEVMHQVQAPVCGHVTNPTDREFNLFLPSQFEDFAEKRFRNENNVGKLQCFS